MLNRLKDLSPTVTVELDRFTLTVPTSYAQKNLPTGIYEPLSSAWLRSVVRQGDTTLDVGAFAGYFTLLMARAAGDTGHVVAVEPAPGNLGLLHANVHENGIANVEVVAGACGRDGGRRTLFLSGWGSTNGFYGPSPPDLPVTGEVEVSVYRLDDLVAPPVHVAKIDVEGAEIEVLEGMERLLRDSPSIHLLVEWNPGLQQRAGSDPWHLPRLLLDKGFVVVALQDQSGQSTPAAELLRGDLPPAGWWCNLACTPT